MFKTGKHTSRNELRAIQRMRGTVVGVSFISAVLAVGVIIGWVVH